MFRHTKQRMIKLFKVCPKTGTVRGFQTSKIKALWLWPFLGLASVVWIIIRVIPKPSRAAYPCMKVAAPIASTFIVWATALFTSVFAFKKARQRLAQSKVLIAGLFLVLGISTGVVTLIQISPDSYADSNAISEFNDPLGPNNPIGQPKGIFPGRVIWVHDPGATNENCTNDDHSDAYWLSSNTDQDVVDNMFSDALKSLTGEVSDTEAWDAVFRYFNQNHGKGDVAYSDSETVFIKINAVTAWGGAWPDGEMPSSRAIECDTSPQTIMTLLRQLVYNAGVPEANIYIGDPIADIYNHLYNYFHAEFPDIKYCSKRNIDGRYKITPSSQVGVTYSDKGTVMTEITTHKFFQEMMDADYILNIPTMKGHRWAGVSFFAKNHFGSNTTDGSWQLHKGLMNPDDTGMRYGYHLYRVLVDLMGSKYLGGKTLLFFMDGLWSTSYEHQKPQKFQSAPWNDDYSSSILLSLDPVAIESVGLDILQKEFTEEEIVDGWDGEYPDRWTYVQWDGIDDYLHQAASSDWWPDDITYDPDNSGTPIGSLGVHEHWNDTDDMEYSRNLGTGEGIELIKISKNSPSIVEENTSGIPNAFVLRSNYPNPFNPSTTIVYSLPSSADIRLNIYNLKGQKVRTLVNQVQSAGTFEVKWNGRNDNNVRVASGVYIFRLEIKTDRQINSQSRQMVLVQ